MVPYVNIHTHRPTGRGVELRADGVHPWNPEIQAVAHLAQRLAEQRTRLRGTDEPVSATEWNPSAECRDTEAIQAIGEIGLDFVCPSNRSDQLTVLRAQLAIARREAMPVVLHCVKAFEPLMRELQTCEPRAVIFHGFIGSPEQARRAIARGYCLAFGPRSFVSPKSLRALHEVPPDRLFLETDDAPVAIEHIYDQTARELGIPVELLLRTTFENYKRIFEPEHNNG